MTDFFQCLIPVADDGYEIKIIPAVEGGSLLGSSPERRVIRPKSDKRHYIDPMRKGKHGEPVLFRTFADLQGEEEIIKFADRFGLLTVGLTNPNDEETIDDWHPWIKGMQEQVSRIEAGAFTSENWASLAVNFADNAQKTVGLTLTPNSDGKGMTLKGELPNLRSALWVQLGLWAENPGMKQRKCGWCGHWFTFGPGSGTGFHSDRKFCSRPCITGDNNLQKELRANRKEQGL